MRNEERHIGWLVLFDGRSPGKKSQLPPLLAVPEGVIQVIAVDINPTAPSRIRG